MHKNQGWRQQLHQRNLRRMREGIIEYPPTCPGHRNRIAGCSLRSHSTPSSCRDPSEQVDDLLVPILQATAAPWDQYRMSVFVSTGFEGGKIAQPYNLEEQQLKRWRDMISHCCQVTLAHLGASRWTIAHACVPSMGFQTVAYMDQLAWLAKEVASLRLSLIGAGSPSLGMTSAQRTLAHS